MQTSTDNISWTLQTSGFGATAISKVVYGSQPTDTYVAVSVSGTLMTSSDTISWTFRTTGFGTTAINSIDYYDNAYVIAGGSGQTRTSTDAISWVLRTTGFGTTLLNAVVYNSAIDDWIVAANGAGGLFTSNQATIRNLGTGGLLRYSTDTIAWELRTTSVSVQAVSTMNKVGAFILASGTNSLSQTQRPVHSYIQHIDRKLVLFPVVQQKEL